LRGRVLRLEPNLDQELLSGRVVLWWHPGYAHPHEVGWVLYGRRLRLRDSTWNTVDEHERAGRMFMNWADYRGNQTQPGLAYSSADKLMRLLGALYLSLGVLKVQGLAFPESTLEEYLRLPNPVLFFLSNRAVLGIGALLEVFIGTYGLRSHHTLTARAGLLLWLAGSSILYKIALVFVRYKGPCGCLLGVNRFLPLRMGTQREIADYITIGTLLATLSVLLGAWWLRRRSRGWDIRPQSAA
jgi:hypothetical protein